MKAAVVQLSTLRKHKRWDVAFYVGNPKERQEEIDAVEKTLQKTATRLANLKKAMAADKKRVKALIDAGEVVPIAGGYSTEK